MYNKEFTERITRLECRKDDIATSTEDIKYDKESPFLKYYSFDAVSGAIDKLLEGKWDVEFIGRWAYQYCWILLGGCAPDTHEELDFIGEILKNIITYAIDGLSFFDSSHKEYARDANEMKDLFGKLDCIWKTREEWRAVCTSAVDEDGASYCQYILFINDTSREEMMVYYDGYEEEFSKGNFKNLCDSEFSKLFETLKNDGYKVIEFSEKFYYMDFEDD